MNLKDVKDVRIVNAETFRMHEYPKYESCDNLIRELYNQWL